MSRRYTHDNDTALGGGCVAAFVVTIVLTLAAFFLANAGLFDPKPVARAGSPPRGDVIVLSNGEVVPVNSRLRALPSGMAQPSLRSYPNSQERLAAVARKPAYDTR